MVPTEPWGLIVVTIGAGGLSFLTGWAVRVHGARLNLVDIPNSRSSHEHPTPRGGGLGIVAGTLTGICLLYAVGSGPAPTLVLALGAGGAVIAGVSFLDDLWGLAAAVRLGVHLLAAALAVFVLGPFPLDVLPTPLTQLPGLAEALTVLWIAGMTNAYNFMDGIDGVAGTQAVSAAIGWAVAGLWLGMVDLVIVGALLAATALGFLLHNWPPARLFMGDVGSAFLGFALAVLTVAAAGAHPLAPLAGAAMLWPFIFDPLFTLVRRIRRRENLLNAHRSHLYQRLVGGGWTHRSTCALYLALAAVGSVVGWVLLFDVEGALVVLSVYAILSFALVSRLVQRAEAPPSAAMSAARRR
jgi:Fuc2NAc and GlcNAc transferase